ncbi:hypothetical protein [Teichococcus aestuarii]
MVGTHANAAPAAGAAADAALHEPSPGGDAPAAALRKRDRHGLAVP